MLVSPTQHDMQAEITQLITYPIKSCAGIQHTHININELGLNGDRQWMLVDDNGVFISQRKYPQMALITPHIKDSILHVSAPGMTDLQVSSNDADSATKVTVWKDTLVAQQLNATANQWFSAYLGISVTLVKYTEITKRPIDPAYASTDQLVAFADGYPVLVTHQATLNQLNQKLETPVAMSRFRPNIVLQSPHPAWNELNWHELSTEQLKLNLVKPCTRCVMTGVEQTTGEQTGTDVLKTLRKKFAHNNKAVFGINAIPDIRSKSEAVLSVGMNLDIH